MKELLAGVVLIFVVGVGAFLYRNTMERPGVTVAERECTLEAKVCPDGSAVGRTGPSCEFAPCAFPNVEILRANVSFLAPSGYSLEESAGAQDPNVLATFVKPSLGGWPPHTIVVRQYAIEGEATGDEVILENTTYQPSGEHAADFSRFRNLSLSGRVFRATTIERFEALVHSSYFLVREADVLRFDIVEHDVVEWMSDTPAENFPEHQALQELLRTLQTIP
ncbi:MAG TPA: hypothetical protein PK609_00535 [Candidatus Paceibacterota bacterium]|nr:hypothetical protein [Candidatus Paceibacterota bacterium]